MSDQSVWEEFITCVISQRGRSLLHVGRVYYMCDHAVWEEFIICLISQCGRS